MSEDRLLGCSLFRSFPFWPLQRSRPDEEVTGEALYKSFPCLRAKAAGQSWARSDSAAADEPWPPARSAGLRPLRVVDSQESETGGNDRRDIS
jgi:hypothetical protein